MRKRQPGQIFTTPDPGETEQERAELHQTIFDFSMLAYLIEYRRSQNPLFLMEAFREYRTKGFPVPEWIMEYFDRVADGFLKEAGNRGRGKKSQRDAFLIKNIMEMNPGKGDPFNNYAKMYNEIFELEGIIRELVEKNPLFLSGSKKEIARTVVAAYNETIQEKNLEKLKAKELQYDKVYKLLFK